MQFHHYRNFHVLCRGYFSAGGRREKFDAYILVGGSVLNYSCLSDLCYQLKEILICAVLRVRSVPSMVVGANVTMPLRSRHFWAAKLLLSLRLRLLDLTTVRDSLSYRIMAPLSPGRVRCYPIWCSISAFDPSRPVRSCEDAGDFGAGKSLRRRAGRTGGKTRGTVKPVSALRR